ncbi:hypothetical protein PIB30_101952 [Stylosanthes scabra]|uniref:Replication factor A C-terminal domain-containing protein n=1 Tax=Stylosanthes scabra TaxID=79078 RepID=A0ABU6VYV3_9FABA|nr:hypothetical protein [Stylosanthes scabra]
MSGRISQVHSEVAFTGVEELIKGRATLETIEEEGQPWIAIKIVALNVGSSDWCYNACVGCKKKVYTQDGTNSNIKHCTKDAGERVVRYKVDVIANDNTECINLLLWDREAKSLCGKKLRQKRLKRTMLSSKYKQDVIADEEVIGKCTLVKGSTSTLSTELGGNAVNLIADSYHQYSVDDLDESVSIVDAKTPAKIVSPPTD